MFSREDPNETMSWPTLSSWRILAAKPVVAIPRSGALPPAEKRHGSGSRFTIVDEPSRVSQRRAMAETDQLRFELDEPPGGSAILGRVEREEPLGLAQHHPCRCRCSGWQSTSPSTSTPSASRQNETCPAVCPGVSITVNDPDLVTFAEPARDRMRRPSPDRTDRSPRASVGACAP